MNVLRTAKQGRLLAKPNADGPGVIILDRSGRVSAANASATALLRLGKILHAPRGTLKASKPAIESVLQNVIAGARGPSLRERDAKNLALLPRHGRTPLVMMAAPIAATAHADSSVLVLLHDPDAALAPTAELLNHVFEDHLEDELNIEFLFDDPLVVVAGAHSRWARRRMVDLKELVDEPWILFDRRSAR